MGMTVKRFLARVWKTYELFILTFIIIVCLFILGYMHKFTDLSISELFNRKSTPDAKLTKNLTQKYILVARVRVEKIDWHNYTQIEIEGLRTGLGEQGAPASLESSGIDVNTRIELYSNNGFNGALSNMICLNRSLPDLRHRDCKDIEYLSVLPTVSVVIPCYNEQWSTLLRTIYSVLNRTPSELLKEIIVVDDGSSVEDLKQKLQDYVDKYLPAVTVLRRSRRRGLIQAKMVGANYSTGDVLVFLDSHTEANVNWLPPLLEPIALDYRTVTLPLIDCIDADDFAYKTQDEGARGSFDWNFSYKRVPITPKDSDNLPNPFPTPLMAGGLFAISRKFFFELGGYDPGLLIWGGENYEISFKVWQCHGRMLEVPCSRVGHVFRLYTVNWPPVTDLPSSYLLSNYLRVAYVWMDEYAEFLMMNMNKDLLDETEVGNLDALKAVRRNLKCKSFKWYMTQIAFDQMSLYPVKDLEPFGHGRIFPASFLLLCATVRRDARNVTLETCAEQPQVRSIIQRFLFTWRREIKTMVLDICWDVPESASGSPVQLFHCHKGGGNQEFKYDENTQHLSLGTTDVCIDWSPATLRMFVNECNNSTTQRWRIENVDSTRLAQWEESRVRVTGPTEIVDE